MRLFLGNLPFSTTEADIYELLHPYGTPVDVKLITDRETGQSKGFGFADMHHEHEAQAAITALDRTDLGGRRINVSKAKPKPEREGREDESRQRYARR